MSHEPNPLEAARSFQLDTNESSWYDLWHTHVDWDGQGDDSPDQHEQFIAALFEIFEKAVAQSTELSVPSNVWLLFVPNSSADDAVYVHTPNPNGSEFPYSFEGVEWGVEPPRELQPHLKPEYEVGVSQYNQIMYWVRSLHAT